MKKILFLLIVGLSLASPVSAEWMDELWNDTRSEKPAINASEAPERIAAANGLLAINTEATVVIKEEIDEQAGKVNEMTLTVVAAAAVFAYWLNKKKKQEFN